MEPTDALLVFLYVAIGVIAFLAVFALDCWRDNRHLRKALDGYRDAAINHAQQMTAIVYGGGIVIDGVEFDLVRSDGKLNSPMKIKSGVINPSRAYQ